MRKLVLILTLLCLAQPGWASFIRLDHGRVLIKSGTPAHQLVRYLGPPQQKSRERVCTERRSSSRCDRWSIVELWFYRHDNRNWTIQVEQGVIREMEWSR